ncbi:hypothetical protein [Sorangium sp. So ce385]
MKRHETFEKLSPGFLGPAELARGWASRVDCSSADAKHTLGLLFR